MATDTLTPSPAPVVYHMSGPMGGGFLYTTDTEAQFQICMCILNHLKNCSGARDVRRGKVP